MTTLLIGGLGNMGRRYGEILKDLDVDYVVKDVGLNDHINYQAFDHAIICTPTNTHMQEIYKALGSNENIKILCEKPLTKGPYRDFDQPFFRSLKNIHMVNNYDYAFKRACLDQSNFVNATGLTYYEYYHTGNDGLLYDCIQLIRLAKADIVLKGYGHKWHCQINGWHIDRNLIDDSYYDMIEDFVSDKMDQMDLDELIKLHKFIGIENEQFEQESLFLDESKHWHSSADNIKAFSCKSSTTTWG